MHGSSTRVLPSFCSPWRRVKGFERIFSISSFFSFSFSFISPSSMDAVSFSCLTMMLKGFELNLLKFPALPYIKTCMVFRADYTKKDVYDFHHQMHEISIYSSGEICLIPRSHSSSPLLCLSNVIYHFPSSHRQSLSALTLIITLFSLSKLLLFAQNFPATPAAFHLSFLAILEVASSSGWREKRAKQAGCP